jgi:hypothetical protein
MAPPLPNDRNSQRPGIAIPGPAAPPAPIDPAAESPEEHLTGLPLLSTWPRLYTFVLTAFLLIVGGLLWLTRAFS